jgi:hypothetical protein
MKTQDFAAMEEEQVK